MLITRHARLVLAIAFLTDASTAFGQLKIIVSGGFASAWAEIAPQFERRTGATVATTRGASQGSGPNTIAAQLRREAVADIVIMSREGLNDLMAEGRIEAGTEVDIAQSPLGLSVRAGAQHPDISTVDAFKQTLLRAKSITFPGSTTGIWLTGKLFPQLGIMEELKGKLTNAGVAAVAKGVAELAIQPVSELLHVEGAEYVGTIPPEIQYISVFSAAIVAGTKEPELAKRLLTFLRSEIVTKAIQRSGMELPHSLH